MGAFVCTHAGALHTLRALVVQHHPLCPCIQISLLPLCPPWNSFHLPSLSSPKLLFPQLLCSFLKNRYQVLFNIDFSVLFWLFNWRIIALQWCVDFCHQQCESAMSINMSPPSGASVPTLVSSHVLCTFHLAQTSCYSLHILHDLSFIFYCALLTMCQMHQFLWCFSKIPVILLPQCTGRFFLK